MSHAVVGSATTTSLEVSWRNYRTVSCYFYEKGICSKGNACTFLHSDANEPLAPIGAPPGSNVFYRAPRVGTVMCRYFERGACKLGQDCSFSHDSSSKAVAASASERGIVRVEPSPSHPIGWKFRTLPCKFFVEGKCRKGDECTYLHIEDDDRVSSGRFEKDARQTEALLTGVGGKVGTQTVALHATSCDLSTDVPTSSSATSSDDSDDARSEASLRGRRARRLSSTCIESAVVVKVVDASQTANIRLHNYGPPPAYPPPPPPPQEEQEEAFQHSSLVASSGLHALPPWRRSTKAHESQHTQLSTSPLVVSEAVPSPDSSDTAVKVMVWRGQHWECEVWDLQAMALDIGFES